MEFGGDDNEGYEDNDNIEELLDDLAVGEDGRQNDFAKRDSTIFIIDCCEEIMKPFEGETKSEFEKIIESYSNFMMSKIIANTKDLVGLILFNINHKQNSLNFDKICTAQKLEEPSATSIKTISTLTKDYISQYGIVSQDVPLHHVLWLYGNEVKELDGSKNHLRLFLFTADDCPHAIGDERRDQAINHARQLASKGVQIELFPIRKSKRCSFDIKKFYQEVISFDPEDINENILDSSSKILDLQSRLRQKEFKKRTLNRLLMKIGNETEVGLKIFCLFNKAKKPLGKKVEATSNKQLKRVVKRMNQAGEVMFDDQVGTYYPLAKEKIKITKNDMNKIKSLEKPGLSLIGFKPKSYIKPYHNLRPSYFLYPDEEHVGGSSQFFDALIEELSEQNKVAIVKITPRQNQETRFAALFPQKENYDEEHEQKSPGFNMIILPYADDIANFAGNKTIVKPDNVSSELVQVTKLLINNLTVKNFDLRDFENPSLQKFYAHLQAHALNEPTVEEREDLLMPDFEGLNKIKDIIDFVKETANEEVIQAKKEGKISSYCEDEDEKPKKEKKESKKEIKIEEPAKKSKVQSQKTKEKNTEEIEIEIKEEEEGKSSLLKEVEAAIFQGEGDKLKVNMLKEYLREKSLSDKGKKEELIDRIMVYISSINEI